MTKAYLNALGEEANRETLLEWLHKLDAENDELRHDLKRAMENHNADLNAVTEVAAPDMISIAAIQEEIAHIQQNGIDVAKFGGQDLDEGRCRELCAMYLSEFILSHRLGQQLDALDAQRSKNQLAVAEANRRLDAASSRQSTEEK